MCVGATSVPELFSPSWFLCGCPSPPEMSAVCCQRKPSSSQRPPSSLWPPFPARHRLGNAHWGVGWALPGADVRRHGCQAFNWACPEKQPHRAATWLQAGRMCSDQSGRWPLSQTLPLCPWTPPLAGSSHLSPGRGCPLLGAGGSAWTCPSLHRVGSAVLSTQALQSGHPPGWETRSALYWP